MSILYEIDKAMGTTYVVWDGTVSGPMFLTHATRLSSDANWPPHERLHITDLRRVSLDASIDDATLTKAADIYGRLGDKLARMKVAIVAHDGFERALAFGRLLNQRGAMAIVFNHLHMASMWLGMDGNQVESRLWQLRANSRGIVG